MRYYIFKLGSDERIVAGYDRLSLERANRHFCENTCFDSIENWVRQIGCYACNAEDFESSNQIDVLIDMWFEVPDTPTDYEVMEYNRFKAKLVKLLNALVDETQPT